MNRACVFVALLSFTATTSSRAADWSDTAFPVKSHDFGTVAVAAKTEFTFPGLQQFLRRDAYPDGPRKLRVHDTHR